MDKQIQIAIITFVTWATKKVGQNNLIEFLKQIMQDYEAEGNPANETGQTESNPDITTGNEPNMNKKLYVAAMQKKSMNK